MANTHTTTTQQAVLSIEDVADECGVSTKTVRNWISSGHIPAYRIGKRCLRIKRSDLEAALKPVTA
jgi:excisionase family DNA binding protein